MTDFMSSDLSAGEAGMDDYFLDDNGLAQEDLFRDDAVREDTVKEKRRKGRSGLRKRHLTEMLALISVIALSSCVLVLHFAQGYVQSSRDSIDDERRVSEKLNRIQNYIESLGTQTEQEEELKEKLSHLSEEQYQELSGTVSGLEKSLSEYREAGDIQSESISGDLDGVIDSLAKIRTELENARTSGSGENQEIGKKLAAMSDADRASEMNISEELSKTRSSIETLLSRISEDGDENYEKLAERLRESGSRIEGVQESLMDGLHQVKSAADTSGIRTALEEDRKQLGGSIGLLSEQLAMARTDVEGLRTAFAEAEAGRRSAADAALTETGSRLNDLSHQLDRIREGVDGTQGALTSITDRCTSIADRVASADEHYTSITGQYSALSEQVASIRTDCDRIHGEYEALNGRLQNIDAALGEVMRKLEESGSSAAGPAPGGGQPEDGGNEPGTPEDGGSEPGTPEDGGSGSGIPEGGAAVPDEGGNETPEGGGDNIENAGPAAE